MDIVKRSIDTLRVLSAEQVQKANSGHPGLPLGAAPMAYTLFHDVMNHNPNNPNWENRDRFILSAGHGSALLYALYHVFGYDLPMEELKNFRQLDSLTPGHPEVYHTVGVEATTGPLGQGLAMGVGMAMAEAHLAKEFNTEGLEIIDHYTYVIAGDGCMMEGITNEASSLAGTLGLGKLIVLYDSNNITIEGSTDLAFTENVQDRYRALGWDVHFVSDGNDTSTLLETIHKAKENKRKPSFIEIKTQIGYGSAKAGTASAHGEPLGEENVIKLKEYLEWETKEEFTVPSEVTEFMGEFISRAQEKERAWNEKLEAYREKYPQKANELIRRWNNERPKDYETDELYHFEKDMATRTSSGIVLNRLSEKLPELFGGSADLAPSNKTMMEKREAFSRENYGGSNVHFGVRELAMAAVSNGIALHGGLLSYCATFLIFSDYLKPALRLSALMKQQVIYIFTHDSIGVGEDGPTHQPIDQLAMLRAVPNLTTIRPCDARETAAAWSFAVNHHGPTALCLTRQNLKALENTGKEAQKGGYILADFGDKLDILLMASGSEVALVLDAAKRLHANGYGVRVISMPCFELFEAQESAYKENVLPGAVRKRLAVEASRDAGWYRYVGLDGAVIGMDGFGASAPANQLFERFGFTAEHIIEKALALLKSEEN